MTSKKRHNTEKRPLLALLLLSLVFYGSMLLLTMTAKDIHLARLPKVTASRLENVSFTYLFTPEGGKPRTITKEMPGIPKELYDSGQIFAVTSTVTEDMTYYYAKIISLEIDPTKKNEDYYAVTELLFRDMVILSGYEELKDGDEVNLLKDK